jgi:hypothetical protein
MICDRWLADHRRGGSAGTLANRLLHHDGAPQLGAVNIHHLLERLTDLLQAQPQALRLKHDYDPSVPDLLGDADRLQQILLNLARNAQEAGAQTLTLRTRVEHGLRWGDRMLRMALRIDVIDDGPGVPCVAAGYAVSAAGVRPCRRQRSGIGAVARDRPRARRRTALREPAGRDGVLFVSAAGART